MNFDVEFRSTILDTMDNEERAYYIDKYVRGERNRAILKRKLIDEITHERIAEEFNISVTHVKRILSKTQEQFFKHYI